VVIRKTARKLLENQGFIVVEAADGDAALKRLQTDDSVDMMVLDLGLPKLGGREVLRAVRKDAKTAGLPVVRPHRRNGRAARVAADDEGADDYINKPIDPKRFVAARQGGPAAGGVLSRG